MEKGYYVCKPAPAKKPRQSVAIHNKNGQGLLQVVESSEKNKNSQSQSTIKMDKGYYNKASSSIIRWCQ